MTDSGKHASLPRQEFIYDRKNVQSTGPEKINIGNFLLTFAQNKLERLSLVSFFSIRKEPLRLDHLSGDSLLGRLPAPPPMQAQFQTQLLQFALCNQLCYFDVCYNNATLIYAITNATQYYAISNATLHYAISNATLHYEISNATLYYAISNASLMYAIM